MALFGKSEQQKPNRTKDSAALKKWLDNLQQESWQLELVVSGFAIFLLIAGLPSVRDWIQTLQQNSGNDASSLTIFGGVFLYFSWQITLLNLVIHVILRGLWIGAVGLRYVSGDINFWQLNFKEPYNRLLRRRIVSYDQYIESLERLCSIIFAFTFLLVLMVLSFVGVILFIVLIVKGMQGLEENFGFQFGILKRIFILILLFGGLLTFIDFITFSRLKKSRWLSKIYYPFYRIYSVVTFAFLYRAIYYNFIDNRLGRKALLLAIPYLFIITLLTDSYFEGYRYWGNTQFLVSDADGYFLMKNNYYDDERTEEDWINRFSIPSNTITTDYLPVFLRYRTNDDEALELLCADLESTVQEGFQLGANFRAGMNSQLIGDIKEPDSLGLALNDCLINFYQVYINDSLLQIKDAVLYRHPSKGERGLQTHIDISYLPDGLHRLKVVYQDERDGKLEEDLGGIAPFWKH